MTQFASIVAEKWGISESLADALCKAHSRGDNPFYLHDYQPSVSAELESSQLFEIFEYLAALATLQPKRKRLVIALQKAGKLTPAIEEHINYISTSHELDDMLASHRLNLRSKGQIAAAKGLGELAHIIEQQEERASTLEEIAEAYVGKHPSLKTVEDVLAGVKDILLERFSTDSTARSMARDFGYEKGQIDVVPKQKKDKQFAAYVGKLVNARDLIGEKFLELLTAEEQKLTRVKLNVQLFVITELLKQHFLSNPDAVGYDFASEIIDECWNKILQPLIECDVKERLREESEHIVIRTILQDMAKSGIGAKVLGPLLSIGGTHKEQSVLVAFDADGRLLGATTTKGFMHDKSQFVTRISQFFVRYRPVTVILHDDEAVQSAEDVVRKVLDSSNASYDIIRYHADTAEALAESDWMKKSFGDLDDSMRLAYARGLAYVKPMGIISQAGIQLFPFHPLQNLVKPEKMNAILNRLVIEQELARGIAASRVGDSAFAATWIAAPVLDEIKKNASRLAQGAREDLKNITGISSDLYSNIAGYIVFPDSGEPLDRTLMHPEHYDWIREACSQLSTTVESLISDPDMLRSCQIDDAGLRIFIEKKMIPQLKAGQNWQPSSGTQVRRKLTLSEIKDDAVMQGRVTNITQFGVFIDINALCDGLVHISQLADTYVETPEQVVSVGDRVSVRVVKVDPKKRRISLSMKGLGHQGPKVKPTKGHLNSLADHFKNR